jgi:hypothetical protein
MPALIRVRREFEASPRATKDIGSLAWTALADTNARPTSARGTRAALLLARSRPASEL